MESQPSFLSRAGDVLKSIVKHVPGRGLLWAVIGFVVGALGVGLSFVIGLLVLERGALLLGYLLAIPFAIPFLGAALFGLHGLHRGAARAALEIEKKFGLVRYVVDRVTGLLNARVGHVAKNLPIAQFETQLKSAVDRYTGSEDLKEGKGMAAWVVNRGKRAIAKRLDKYLLAAYRVEQEADGSGGGVSLEKVAARVSDELSGRLGKIVMSPLNKQLLIFMILYLTLAIGWWYWLFLLMRLFTSLKG